MIDGGFDKHNKNNYYKIINIYHIDKELAF